MKPGDLVISVWCESKVGLLIKRVHDPLAMNNKVFDVFWSDGTKGHNVWDYDLKRVLWMEKIDK